MPAESASHENLTEAFCAAHRCRSSHFARKVFWKSLPPHAVIPSYLLGGPNNRVFDHDELRQFRERYGTPRRLKAS